MTLKNLVYDYDLSKKLYDLIEEKSKENGSFIENACFIWVKYEYRLKGDNPKSEPRTMTKCVMNGSNYKLKNKEVVEIIPAYTPNELYQHMPKTISANKSDSLGDFKYYNLKIYCDINSVVYGGLEENEDTLFIHTAPSMKSSIYDMAMTLLKNGLKLSPYISDNVQHMTIE